MRPAAPLPRSRPLSRSVLGCLLIAALTGLMGGGDRPASGVEGNGNSSGSSAHLTEFENNGNGPPKAGGGNDGTLLQPGPGTVEACAKQNSTYVGAGAVNLTQGRVTYSGPITLEYSHNYYWGGPTGTFKPMGTDDMNIACNKANYGPHPLENASLEGVNEAGHSIKCEWTSALGSTFRRSRNVEEEMILPGGSGMPAEGGNGTCTITPPEGGHKRTSNTRVVINGVLDPGTSGASVACTPVPAPPACHHVYSLTATTVGPVPPEPPPVPSLIVPGSLMQGSTDQTVKVTGKEFDKQATLSLGPGVTVNTARYESITSLSANISVASDAAVGPRDVTVTNADGLSGVCAACLQIIAKPPAAAAPPSPPPGSTINTINPPFQGPGNTPPPTTGGAGSNSTAPGPAEAVPAAQISQNVVGTGSASQPITPVPPGGTGSAPVTVSAGSFVPTASGAGAPVGMASEAAEEAAESAPEAGARIMMVRHILETRLAETVLMSFGIMVLVGCFSEIRKARWPAAPQEALEPAPAWATAQRP